MIHLNNCDINVMVEDPGDWADGGMMGQCSLIKGYIKINNKMPEDIQASTFLHELVHMIALMGSVKLEESEVDVLASGMLSYIKDNGDDLMERFYGN